MTTFPGSPKTQKGAIVGLDPINPMASVIVFQYNPDTLTRTQQCDGKLLDATSVALRLSQE